MWYSYSIWLFMTQVFHFDSYQALNAKDFWLFWSISSGKNSIQQRKSGRSRSNFGHKTVFEKQFYRLVS